MIMQRVRKVTKYFMWVVAVSFVLFIFFGFGSNLISGREETKDNLIAEVNGAGIDYREFSFLLSSKIKFISGSIGIDPLRERMLYDQVINELIMDRILKSQIIKRDIFISDKQIIDIIKNSPPREIYQDTTFWIGGQFDYSRYYELLKEPRLREFINDYAKRIKEDLPRRILSGEISSLVRLTQSEIMENLMEDSVNLRLEYIRIPLDEWMEEEVAGSPEEFYSIRKDMFKREGIVRLGYVSFPVEVDDQMYEQVKDLTFSIIKRALNMSFDTLISVYSYFPMDRRLFDGWISVESLPSSFITSLLGMKIGEVTDPILSDEGYHIIKLLDRMRDSLNIKEIFLPLFPSTETYMNVMTEALSLVKLLRSDTTHYIPDTYEVEYITYSIGYIPAIGVDFGTFLDNPKKGEVSHPLVGDGSLYVFWIEDLDIGVPPLSLIREEVIDSMRTVEASDRAKKYVKENFPEDELIRFPEKGSWHRTTYFTLNNYIEKGVDLPEKIVNLALYLTERKVSPPVRAGGSIYIVKVIEKKSPEEIKSDFASSLQMMKQMVYYQGWLYDLRQSSMINDWRSKLYE